jgi:chemotaxis protein histidine kinase CheA
VDAAFETNAEPGLVDLFRAEADTHLPVLSQGLLALERGQIDDQITASMMRAAHSIKGAARIVGIDAAVRVAHILEDCFTAAKDRRSLLSSEAVDVLLEGVDALQRICALEPDAGMTAAWLDSVLANLAAIREGRTPAKPPPAAPVAVRAQPAAESSFTLPADFDDAAAEALRGPLHDALESGVARIQIDFEPVRQISARGLALLAALTREATRRDPPAALRAEGPSGPLAALLRVTGLDRALIAGE